MYSDDLPIGQLNIRQKALITFDDITVYQWWKPHLFSLLLYLMCYPILFDDCRSPLRPGSSVAMLDKGLPLPVRLAA
jgi:hypothetical protein